MGTSVSPCELHLHYLPVSVPLTWWLEQGQLEEVMDGRNSI